MLLSETVAPHTTLVSQGSGSSPTTVAQQATPDYSLPTPQNQFYFSTATGTPALATRRPVRERKRPRSRTKAFRSPSVE